MSISAISITYNGDHKINHHDPKTRSGFKLLYFITDTRGKDAEKTNDRNKSIAPPHGKRIDNDKTNDAGLKKPAREFLLSFT